MTEYRICWAASSNISFRSSTGWTEWEGDESGDQIEEALTAGPIALPMGLEEALEASGFEWWAEVRA